jgi:hypothetical protein
MIENGELVSDAAGKDGNRLISWGRVATDSVGSTSLPAFCAAFVAVMPTELGLAGDHRPSILSMV